MCELLELSPGDVVLDVGSGSGYHAALLSRLCRHVYGIELDAELADAGVALARPRRDRQRDDRCRATAPAACPPMPRTTRSTSPRPPAARCRPRSSSSSRPAGGSSPRSRRLTTSASSSCAAAPGRTGPSSARSSTPCASCRCADASVRRAAGRSRRGRPPPRRPRRAGSAVRISCGISLSSHARRSSPDAGLSVSRRDRPRRLVDDPAHRRVDRLGEHHLQPRPVQRGDVVGRTGGGAERPDEHRHVLQRVAQRARRRRGRRSSTPRRSPRSAPRAASRRVTARTAWPSATSLAARRRPRQPPPMRSTRIALR